MSVTCTDILNLTCRWLSSASKDVQDFINKHEKSPGIAYRYYKGDYICLWAMLNELYGYGSKEHEKLESILCKTGTFKGNEDENNLKAINLFRKSFPWSRVTKALKERGLPIRVRR